MRVGSDTDGFETDALDPRTPTRCHEQSVAPQFRTVVQLQHEFIAVPPGGGGVHPQHQLDSIATQRLAKRRA